MQAKMSEQQTYWLKTAKLLSLVTKTYAWCSIKSAVVGAQRTVESYSAAACLLASNVEIF